MHHLNSGFGLIAILVLFIVVIALASSGGSKG
jgi:hypothetical protein